MSLGWQKATCQNKALWMGGRRLVSMMDGTKENGTNHPKLAGNHGVFSQVSATYNSSHGKVAAAFARSAE